MKAQDLSLFTDLYELTMAQSYFEHGMFASATFSLFIRSYPPNRSYFVAAGLEDVLTYLQTLHFSKDSMDYLRSTGIFSPDFLAYLSDLRFTGNVWAMPEGGIFFTDEPILEITGPIIEAQIVETYIINQINLQSLIATKAARCIWAAKGKALVDFASRRTHGTDAGLKVARASYIAGFQATSNVLAGKKYSMPLSGTMAHSFITSYESELDAFRAFASSFPERCILLIDTYDTISGAKNAVTVAKEMEARGHQLRAVRLDSGDINLLSREVRAILDQAGLLQVRIVATGGLDEFDVDELVGSGAPIDSFGIGTKMGVSSDAPWSDMAYKLVRYDGRPVLKLSTDKVSLPDAKQVVRTINGDGMFKMDTITLRDEHLDSAERDGLKSTTPIPLLAKAMGGGKITLPHPSLGEIRGKFEDEFAYLEERFKALHEPPRYDVTLSPCLNELYHSMTEETIIQQSPS